MWYIFFLWSILFFFAVRFPGFKNIEAILRAILSFCFLLVPCFTFTITSMFNQNVCLKMLFIFVSVVVNTRRQALEMEKASTKIKGRFISKRKKKRNSQMEVRINWGKRKTTFSVRGLSVSMRFERLII